MQKIWWLIIILAILLLGLLFSILRNQLQLSPFFSSRQTDATKFAEVPIGGSCTSDAQCSGGWDSLACCGEKGAKTCTDTSTDEENCGLCGNKCAEGETCYDPPGLQWLGCHRSPQSSYSGAQGKIPAPE